MAITQSVCNSFKQQILLGEHDLDTDNIKIALYTASASLDASTTVYTTSNEVTGTGYSAGGLTLTGAAVTLSGSTAVVDFNDAVWAAASITARGALIYNSSKSNKAIAVLNFGADKTSTNDDFKVEFPPAVPGSAIIQVG